jgi:hypothetical protein
MSSQRREVTEGQNNEKEIKNMKNRNTKITALLFVLAFVLAPIVQAALPEDEILPVITIHSTDNITRGKTGSFVLNMTPTLMLGGMYVKFSVGGTAIPGVDYVALVSPAYIGQSGYATILVQSLPNPRGAADRQSYSVVVKLDAGAGYALGQPSSATMWIKP